MSSIDRAAMYDLLPRAAVPGLQYLAALAAKQGRPTDWDRYEAQLPQDGFSLLGRYCRACLNGPCRTSPFGRPGAGRTDERGVCGFATAEMSLAYLADVVARGFATIACDSGKDELFAVAGRLQAAVEPGQTDAASLARAIRSAASAAAGLLASTAPNPYPNTGGYGGCPRGIAVVGLGALAQGRARALMQGQGSGWSYSSALGGLCDAATAHGVQVVATAATAGAYELGIPVVVDHASVQLLSGSRLVSGTIRLPASPASVGGRLEQWATAQGTEDVPQPAGDQQAEAPGAVTLPVWDGTPRRLFVAGSSRVRSALGRGGYHQAVARLGQRLGFQAVGLGDGGYYLAPLGGEIELSVASLGPAVEDLLSRPNEAGEALVAFPEPAFAADLAAAFALAAAGIRVFAGGELPVAREAAELIAAEFGPALRLEVPDPTVPPGSTVRSDGLGAARDWLEEA